MNGQDPLPLDDRPTDVRRWSAGQLAAVLAQPGIGPVGLMKITARWPDPAQYNPAEAAPSFGHLANFLPAALPDPVVPPPGVGLVGLFDDGYPRRLATIPDPPPVLWVRGTLRPDMPMLAVVGTRHPGPLGRRSAAVAAEEAVACGLGVVSGLALGCDALGHETALRAGGYTVAVLGGGLLEPGPASNRGLAERILASGGALISELPPEEPVSARGLVRRNRIQSGLAVAVVVAESGVPGGTLHTARFALEQGRILIVPRPADDGPAGNLALTDLDGCDPSVLQATGELADRIAARRPVADRVVRTGQELREAVRQVATDVVGRGTD